jgi:hypothetical protein
VAAVVVLRLQLGFQVRVVAAAVEQNALVAAVVEWVLRPRHRMNKVDSAELEQ